MTCADGCVIQKKRRDRNTVPEPRRESALSAACLSARRKKDCMKYRIAICDDDGSVSEALSGYIREYLDGSESEYELRLFRTLPALEAEIEAGPFDLLFLDIMIGADNGMAFAKKLREKGNEVRIVFISSNTDYALEAFSVFPVSFLAKPLVRKDVQTVLERVLHVLNQRPFLLINDKLLGRTKVPLDSVCYVESMGHDILLQCVDRKTYAFGGTFSEFVAGLPEAIFFRCHRSYAVNLRYVHRLQDFRFIMMDESRIPIAKPLRKTAMQRFADLTSYD